MMGLADTTIVAYSSEHGEMMGDHGILGKCVLGGRSADPELYQHPTTSRTHGCRTSQCTSRQCVLKSTAVPEQPCSGASSPSQCP